MSLRNRITAQAKRILDTLRPGRPRDPIRSRMLADPIDTISWIQKQQDISSIALILDLLIHEDARISIEATKKIRALFASVRATDLFSFDSWIRGNVTWQGPWDTLKPEQLGSLSKRHGGHEILTLAAFHGNGHVREAAVRLFKDEGTSLRIGVLTVRLNDWVPAVRTAAKQAFLNQIETADHQIVVGYLPLISRLEDCSRTDHSEALSAVIARLRTKKGKAELISSAVSERVDVRRAFRRFASSVFEPGDELIFQLCLRSSDAIIRLSAARLYFSGARGSSVVRNAYRILEDSFPPVKMLALDVLRENEPFFQVAEWNQRGSLVASRGANHKSGKGTRSTPFRASTEGRRIPVVSSPNLQRTPRNRSRRNVRRNRRAEQPGLSAASRGHGPCAHDIAPPESSRRRDQAGLCKLASHNRILFPI